MNAYGWGDDASSERVGLTHWKNSFLETGSGTNCLLLIENGQFFVAVDQLSYACI